MHVCLLVQMWQPVIARMPVSVTGLSVEQAGIVGVVIKYLAKY